MPKGKSRPAPRKDRDESALAQRAASGALPAIDEEPLDRDGRTLRGERSRTAIVDALYELVLARSEDLSIEAVAARARVGTRTVFRHFEQVDSLFAALRERVATEAMTLAAPPPLTRSFTRDLEGFVEARVRSFVYIEQFRAQDQLRRRVPPHTEEQLAALRAIARKYLTDFLAHHVGRGRLPQDELEALDAWISLEVWDRLCVTQHLSRARAERAMLAGALSLGQSLMRTARS